MADRFGDISQEFLQPILHAPRHPIKLARFGLSAGMPASVLRHRFRTEEGRALWAGAAAHAFSPLSSLVSSARSARH